MSAINDMGEFVDNSMPKRTRVRTDEQKRADALAKLVDMGVVRICDVCGRPFDTRAPYQRNAKRCSWECKQEANRRAARNRQRRKEVDR